LRAVGEVDFYWEMHQAGRTAMELSVERIDVWAATLSEDISRMGEPAFACHW
jgi:hypothetical protein